jgi:hypothetical protein
MIVDLLTSGTVVSVPVNIFEYPGFINACKCFL